MTPADPWAKDFVGKNGAGFGPIMSDLAARRQVVFRAHEGYWRERRRSTRHYARCRLGKPAGADQTGAVDVAQWLLNELMQLSKNPAVKLSISLQLQVIYSLNTKKEPFDNQKSARHSNMPIHDAVLKTVFMGVRNRARAWSPRFSRYQQRHSIHSPPIWTKINNLKEASFPTD